MCNILGETFCEVVALKRAGLGKRTYFFLAVFEVLGQLLLEGFAVNSSILQNSYKFFSVLAFRFEQFQISIAQSNAVKFLCLSGSDVVLAQGSYQACCALETSFLLDPQIPLLPWRTDYKMRQAMYKEWMSDHSFQCFNIR